MNLLTVEEAKERYLEENKATQENKTTQEENKTVNGLIKQEEERLLSERAVQGYAKTLAAEGIKAEYAQKGAEIRKKNIETAENEFEIETRDLRLKHLKAELYRDHIYNMKIITADGKHRQELDRRKKTLEKYGYLYDKDENGEPIDFSYSENVNKIRTIVRNISKLDTAVKKLLKWTAIVCVATVAFLILKHFNVIN